MCAHLHVCMFGVHYERIRIDLAMCAVIPLIFWSQEFSSLKRCALFALKDSAVFMNCCERGTLSV